MAASALYAVSAAAVWIPSRSRWTGGGETLGARELMYRDAWELAGAAPWFGQGGETWRHAYRAVQSEPYVGAEVHSGYIDLLLNTGIFGFLMAFALLLATAFRLGQTERRLLPPLSVLLLHSALDFDWSYGLVWLLIVWLAVMADGESSLFQGPRSPAGISQSGRRRQRVRPPIRLGHQILSLRLYWKGKGTGRLALFLACLIGWTALSTVLWKGEQYFNRAQGEQQTGGARPPAAVRSRLESGLVGSRLSAGRAAAAGQGNHPAGSEPFSFAGASGHSLESGDYLR
ncbi:hypothetical protein XI25_01905 [Paenibacillus sp. DMB20]|nr:hypothetical protein XI25_01905 [Paenibacillus sp. DMB20]